MQVNAYPEFLEVVLFPTEIELLRSILHEIDRAYGIPIDQLETTVRNVWFSGEGFRSAEMDREDIREWNQALRDFRGENRSRCQEWTGLLAQGGDPLLWRVARREIDTLITILNDYRLYQAARHEIGQTQMDEDFDFVQSPNLRLALLEIHFLAWLMEMILQAMTSENKET